MFHLAKRFLLSMFQSFPVIQPLEFSDGLLAFRCDRSLPFERLTVASLTSAGSVVARLEVCSYDNSQRVYRGQLENCQETLSLMQLPARIGPRLPLAVRVSSRQLPQYFALTEDLSLYGLRLSTADPLAAGAGLEMDLDLDDPGLPTLTVSGEVCWSAMRADGSYHSGVRFSGLGGAAQRALDSYIERRLESQRLVHGEG